MSTAETKAPSHELQGITFYPIPDVTDEEYMFGFSAHRYFDRASRPSVPKKYEKMAERLFFFGWDIDVPDCIDKPAAIRALYAWLRSWTPPHESKIATAGYALWVWNSMGSDGGAND